MKQSRQCLAVFCTFRFLLFFFLFLFPFPFSFFFFVFGIALKPCPASFIKPGTWHSVITTELAVTTTYHFWNTRTLLDSLIAEIAGLVSGGLLYNAPHAGFRTNLHRLCLLHYHAFVNKVTFHGKVRIRIANREG